MTAPDWIYPDNMHCLPVNAKTFGEKLDATRVKYTRADLCITRADVDAMVLAERERCARVADDEFGGRMIAAKIRGDMLP